MSRTICIYHGNCADGFGAAWAVWQALGSSEIDYVPGFYGQEPPDVGGADVIMVDISYKRPELEQMATRANSILILDHHKTAESDLAGLGVSLPGGRNPPLSWGRHLNEVSQDHMENAYPQSTTFERVRALCPIYVEFDMTRSGAVMAWEFFHPGEPVPTLLKYVQDRDLWRFHLDRSRDVAAAVFSYPYDFDVWNGLAVRMQQPHFWRGSGGVSLDARLLMDEGAAIERKHHKDVAELVDQTRRRAVIAGHDVPVANLPYTMASDACHLMAEGEPFAACYFDRSDGVRVFSLHSHEDGLDVSEIAAQFGGGGHRNAAGFQASRGDFGL